MYSNLAKADYEIKDVNLSTLRNRIIEENNLTPLDILKGFHEKSKITLKYKSALTEQNLKDMESIEAEYTDYITSLIKNNFQKMYDDEFNELFEECKKHCPELTLSDVIDYKKSSIQHNHKSVELNKACFRFTRSISDLNRKLKNKIHEDANEHISNYITEKFGDNYKINLSSKYDSFVGLPYQINVNGSNDLDFSEVYEQYKEYSGDFSDLVSCEYDSHIDGSVEISISNYNKVTIFAHLSESQAKEVFDNAVNSFIYQNNSVGELEYLQNLEAQPITININTKTNKYELIDGYKRLLYITDENLLKYSAPVKFFTDLNDTQFLALLYAANVWKTESRFHDRGYLFALKTRFNFVIPASTYKNAYTEELSTLQLYDFGGNLAHVDTNDIMNTLLNHKHLANDIKLMYNFLPQIAEKQTCDKNMSEEIMFSIIELVGKARRTRDNDLQNELSEEIITSIFEDDFIKKACAKKHLSTRTYVMNYFRDKEIYKRIISILNEKLIKVS